MSKVSKAITVESTVVVLPVGAEAEPKIGLKGVGGTVGIYVSIAIIGWYYA